MMTISFLRDSSGHMESFEARGHTEISEKGLDIACAGISALVQSAVSGCMKYLGIRAGYSQESGYYYFCLPNDLQEEIRGKADAILETMYFGILEIQKCYPEAIKIEEKYLKI